MAAKDLCKQFKGLNINEKKDIYILLLGETGVGKSTFVNALATYLAFEEFEKAEKQTVSALIPIEYTIRDKDSKCYVLNVGPEEANFVGDNDYSTKNIKTYTIPVGSGKTKLYLIDTPGLNGINSPEQNRLCLDRILSYIGQLQEIHAVCYMFTPTDAHCVSTFVDYCLKHMLPQLQKNVRAKLVFLFTKTEPTGFTPGNTWFTLNSEIVRDNNKNSQSVIDFSPASTFLIDNDFFKYLVAKNKGIEFDNASKDKYKNCWNHSAHEYWRLLNHILVDAKPKESFTLKNTPSANEALRLIGSTFRPLFDIIQLIQDNIKALDNHEQSVHSKNKGLDDIKDMLYIPVLSLQVIHLNEPRLICNKCVKPFKVDEVNKWYHFSKCHEVCFLPKMPRNAYGVLELYECEKIDSTTQLCSVCCCHYSLHERIYYDTTIQKEQIDDDRRHALSNSVEILQYREKVVADIKARKIELENERREIIASMAQFAHFVKDNSLVPYRDCYGPYIESLIHRETYSAFRNADNLSQMEDLLNQYKEYKKKFDDAIEWQKRLGDESNVQPLVTVQKIIETVQLKLYGLQHYGKKMKELMKCQKTPRSKELEKTIVSRDKTEKCESKFEKFKDKKDKCNIDIKKEKNKDVKKEKNKGDKKKDESQDHDLMKEKSKDDVKKEKYKGDKKKDESREKSKDDVKKEKYKGDKKKDESQEGKKWKKDKSESKSDKDKSNNKDGKSQDKYEEQKRSNKHGNEKPFKTEHSRSGAFSKKYENGNRNPSRVTPPSYDSLFQQTQMHPPQLYPQLPHQRHSSNVPASPVNQPSIEVKVYDSRPTCWDTHCTNPHCSNPQVRHELPLPSGPYHGPPQYGHQAPAQHGAPYHGPPQHSTLPYHGPAHGDVSYHGSPGPQGPHQGVQGGPVYHGAPQFGLAGSHGQIAPPYGMHPPSSPAHGPPTGYFPHDAPHHGPQVNRQFGKQNPFDSGKPGYKKDKNDKKKDKKKFKPDKFKNKKDKSEKKRKTSSSSSSSSD